MRIMYLGHSCFYINWDGRRIVTDPYNKSMFGEGGYGPQNVEADIVTMSHHHDDHNYTGDLKGQFTVVDRPGKHVFGNFTVEGLRSSHDKQGGAQRGENIIFKMSDGKTTLAHLGDLGRPLSEKEEKFLQGVNILMVPVGGFYTIDASEAYDVVQKIQPNIVLPMHFKTAKTETWPITGVEDFLSHFPSNIIKSFGSEVDIIELPSQMEVWLLNPSR